MKYNAFQLILEATSGNANSNTTYKLPIPTKSIVEKMSRRLGITKDELVILAIEIVENEIVKGNVK